MNTTKAILLIVNIFMVLNVSADDTGIKSSFPFAVLSTDTLDMGIIEQGNRADGQIGITNEGKPDLLIARVRSSCGLMIPTWPDKPVKTGEEVFINFRYNTNRIGPFKRNIIIHTNAWQKTLIVYVHGEVIP